MPLVMLIGFSDGLYFGGFKARCLRGGLDVVRLLFHFQRHGIASLRVFAPLSLSLATATAKEALRIVTQIGLVCGGIGGRPFAVSMGRRGGVLSGWRK